MHIGGHAAKLAHSTTMPNIADSKEPDKTMHFRVEKDKAIELCVGPI